MSSTPHAQPVARQRASLQDLQAIIEQQAAIIEQQAALIEQLQARIAQQEAEIAQLRRKVFGRSSERMPPPEQRAKIGDPEERERRRRERRAVNAEKKRELPVEQEVYEVPAECEQCPSCAGPFRDLGEGEVSSEIEYLPGRFVCRRRVRKKRVCRCGDTIIVADAPTRAADSVGYGPGFHAHVVVAKCCDSIPLYRLSKKLEREGCEVSDSTLGDVFHRSASICKPLYDLIVQEVAESGHVNADETPIRVQAQGKARRAYVWTFIGAGHVAFVFSPTRSGETPASVLGAQTGFLQVDAYTGYNRVCTPKGWTRVGCLAHVRRYFFEAQQTAPEAAGEAMRRISAIYEVEREARQAGMTGTAAHRELRQRDARPLFESLHTWLTQEQGCHVPKSPMGKAITYALNVWPTLLVQLDNPALALDNNAAERALRIVALGRKNFLFVGNDRAGESLAILQTMVATCKAHDVNPEAYLADILIRTQERSCKKRDLLPDRWKILFSG
jgi:transposase